MRRDDIIPGPLQSLFLRACNFLLACDRQAARVVSFLMSPSPEKGNQDDDLEVGDLFNDPDGFYPPEKEPTFAEHCMLDGQVVRVRLVGSHPLYVRH